MGPEKIAEMPKANLQIILHLDETGEFFQISLVATPDNWPFENDLLRREEKESGADFFRRAMLAYRVRTKKAGNQAQAELLLAGAEKIAGAIQVLYKEALAKK